MPQHNLWNSNASSSLKKSWIVLCCAMIIAAGCNNVSTTATSSVLPSRPPSTSTALKMPSATPTRGPSATIAFSPTPTLLVTGTPIPTLQLAEAQKLAEELLTKNADCLLPCWWGITPGTTTWSSAQSLLHQFDGEIYDRTAKLTQPFVAEALIPVRKEIFSLGQLNHKYLVNNDKVELIDVFPGLVSTYELSAMFLQYGKPTEVWVRTDPETPTGRFTFQVVVFYPNLGIIASYHQEAKKTADRIESCYPPSFTTELVLWFPSKNEGFQSVVNQSTSLTDRDLEYQPLQVATQISVDEFFETLSRPGATLCIDTPEDVWR